MQYIRKKHQIEMHNSENYTIQKIWGAFADVVSYKRYESFAGSNDRVHYIKARLSEEEIEKVYLNLEKEFKIKIKVELHEKDTFKKFITKIKKYVRSAKDE